MEKRGRREGRVQGEKERGGKVEEDRKRGDRGQRVERLKRDGEKWKKSRNGKLTRRGEIEDCEKRWKRD